MKIQQSEKAEIIKSDSLQNLESLKIEAKSVVDNLRVKQMDRSSDSEINIIGKTDSLNNFKFHNIVNGDTLQSIIIQGNSTFRIKSKSTDKSILHTTENSESYDNIIQEVARKSVAKKTIKGVSETVIEKSKQVNRNGLSFRGWATFIIVSIVIICFIVGFYYLKYWLKF